MLPVGQVVFIAAAAVVVAVVHRGLARPLRDSSGPSRELAEVSSKLAELRIELISHEASQVHVGIVSKKAWGIWCALSYLVL